MAIRDWERIKIIFEQAKDAREEDLEKILMSLCEGDRSMAEFVCSLVRNDRYATDEASLEGERAFSEGASVAGRLRIVRFIDRGAMGEVYEAFDERLHQRVALKTVRRELIRTRETLSRFEREIRMAREVAHPNLCRVFDYLEDSTGIPCYTMELIQGESLAAFLARDKPLSMSVALAFVRQIARGVDALHQRGMIHRDLKPSNIMLTQDDCGDQRVVLMDFGLAKLLNTDEELFQTKIEQQMGAPYFLAPELLRDGRPSIASDLYSFGLVVDEMVTKRRAISAHSLQALYFAKLWEAPIPPRERSDFLPDNWNAAILRCIASEPEARFKSAGEMVLTLESDSQEAVTVSIERPDDHHRLPAWRPRLKQAIAPFAKKPVVASGAGVALLGAIYLSLPAGRPAPVLVQVYDVENATGNSAVNYLCNGTSDELIRRLTALDETRVVPMRATRRERPRINAQGVSVEGMLKGSGDQLRLTILLSDEKTGAVFDSGVFDLKSEDSLHLENEIAANTVEKIRAHLASTTSGRQLLWQFFSSSHLTHYEPQTTAPTANGTAFDAYLRGRQLLDEYSQESVAAAVTYLRRAVDDDPKFALGYASLSVAQLNETTFMGGDQQPEALVDAKLSASRALELSPSLPEAHAAMAYVLQAQWDWTGAEQQYQQALKLKPAYSSARRRYAGLLLQFGKVDEALQLARQAFADDPYDREAIPGIGLYLYLSGRYDEAIRFLQEQIGENDMEGARHNLGDALAEAAVKTNVPIDRRHLFELALAQATRVASIEHKLSGGSTPKADEMYAHYFTLLGDKMRSDFYLNKLLKDMNQGTMPPGVVAWIYALRGDNSMAFEMLDRAVKIHDRALFYVKLHPALAGLRGEDRFGNLLRQMNLPLN